MVQCNSPGPLSPIYLVSLLVMVNLHCQHDYIWNQLTSKLIGIPVSNFINQIMWRRKTHPKTGSLHIRTQGKPCFLPVCPLSGKFIYSVAAAGIKYNVLVFYCRMRPAAIQEFSGTAAPDRDWRDTQPCGVDNYQLFSFTLWGSCWTVWTTSWKPV